MKKTIVALICVAHITCFAMNEKNEQENTKTGFRDIPRLLNTMTEVQVLSVNSQALSGVAVWEVVELQKSQTKAMEITAHSNRLMACIATEEYTRRHLPVQFYKKLNCQDIYENYLSFEKNSDQS